MTKAGNDWDRRNAFQRESDAPLTAAAEVGLPQALVTDFERREKWKLEEAEATIEALKEAATFLNFMHLEGETAAMRDRILIKANSALTAAAEVGQIDFLCPKCGSRGYIKDDATTITAAAEVGWPSDELINDLVESATQEDSHTVQAAAAEVGETNEQMLKRWDDEDAAAMKAANDATIERCAQVIKEMENGSGRNLSDVAAAIRALKDQQT